MSHKRCETCKYFDPFSEGDAVGKCRINPPVPNEGKNTNGAKWPTVMNDDWCGQHKAVPRAFAEPQLRHRGTM